MTHSVAAAAAAAAAIYAVLGGCWERENNVERELRDIYINTPGARYTFSPPPPNTPFPQFSSASTL